MAERRMFAKTIIDSYAFIDMPITARLLYYDLGMRADDDGFVNSPKKIMRMHKKGYSKQTIATVMGTNPLTIAWIIKREEKKCGHQPAKDSRMKKAYIWSQNRFLTAELSESQDGTDWNGKCFPSVK